MSYFKLCSLALLLLPCVSVAKEIELKLPAGQVITADYQQGKPGKPTLLLLHGYLQTRNFPLIYNLSNALKDSGYTVLAPTLSLGISHRSKSLACEAIHTHSMGDDVREISKWVDWLETQGHKEIILIGHSFGAVQILSYAIDDPSVAVRKLILISTSDVEHKFLSPGRVDKGAALKLAAKDKNAMDNFELGFCMKYRSTASAYLSYVAWTQERVLKSFAKIKIPYELIFGDGDAVVSKDWPERVRKAGANVSIIPNSSHFFEDSSSEFELLGKLETLIYKKAK